MTLRSYLLFMGAGTSVSVAALLLIMNTTDPAHTGPALFAIFYACVFLAVSGLLSILGFSARVFILDRRTFISQEVALAFRQSTLVASMVVAAMLLQGAGKLNWWTGALIVLIVTMGESIMLSGGKNDG